ncbi:CBS domain-containing protein [Sphingomonas rubra]|uniref:CBS domain-containing protein n=1 Tax=Sphingomonas rubra TaxID=634430 RepID=A0A1I5R641_9SPHN|nr:CBS domain-containing protein [Sphingomonas rubra]SFP53761.1 CBS domain-containing protein [Sphingomonas rubra]
MTIAAVLAGRGAAQIVTITTDATVGEAVALLAKRGIGAVPVMDGATVAGIFSERDVLRELARQGADALDRPVSTVMTTPAITVSRDQAVIGALSLMTHRRIRHLPVVEAGQLVGLVSIGDLVKYRIDRIEADAAAMRAYIQSA